MDDVSASQYLIAVRQSEQVRERAERAEADLFHERNRSTEWQVRAERAESDWNAALDLMREVRRRLTAGTRRRDRVTDAERACNDAADSIAAFLAARNDDPLRGL